MFGQSVWVGWGSELIATARAGSGKEKVGNLRKELQASMMDQASVFRTAQTLEAQVAKVDELKARGATEYL